MALQYLLDTLSALTVLAFIWHRVLISHRTAKTANDPGAAHRGIVDEAVTAMENIAGELLSIDVVESPVLATRKARLEYRTAGRPMSLSEDHGKTCAISTPSTNP